MSIQLLLVRKWRKLDSLYTVGGNSKRSATGGNQMRVCEVSSVSDSMQSSEPARLFCPWDCPGKNTRVGCHALLRGNLLTQGSNPHLLHLLHCSGFFPTEPLGKPRKQNTLKHKHTQKLGVVDTIGSANPLLGIYPKELKSGLEETVACPCSLQHDTLQPGCGSNLRSINKGMNKKHTLYIHTGILAFKREEILPHSTTWMNLEDIMLSEISQS